MYAYVATGSFASDQGRDATAMDRAEGVASQWGTSCAAVTVQLQQYIYLAFRNIIQSALAV